MYKSLWLSALQPRRRLDLSVVSYRNFEPGSREEQGQWPGSLMKHLHERFYQEDQADAFHALLMRLDRFKKASLCSA